jgi:hypothetical protein
LPGCGESRPDAHYLKAKASGIPLAIEITLRIIDHNRDLIEERDVELPPLITGQGDVVESDRNG